MFCSSVSQNVLKFYQQLIGEERRVPFIFGQNNPKCFGYGNRLERCGELGVYPITLERQK
jgi:hypothetical protein